MAEKNPHLGKLSALAGASLLAGALLLPDQNPTSEIQNKVTSVMGQNESNNLNKGGKTSNKKSRTKAKTQAFKNSREPLTDYEILQRALMGDTESADLLIDSVESNPMSMDSNQLAKILPDYGLTEAQYDTIIIARTLRQRLNELSDPNIEENAALAWKMNYGETPTNTGSDSIAMESYISGNATYILNLLKFMTAEDAQSDVFLNLAEMDYTDFEQTVRYYMGFEPESERNALLKKFGLAE